MKRLFLLFTLTIFCSVLSTKANTLYGRVVKVEDGKTMTIENTGRQVKVALKLAEPPEKDQPFADVARQHLSGLVLGRDVAVSYTGLGADALLLGRVFCDNRDIGLQMIRDGVAWFDRSYESELNEAERRVYADSEQAARSEHRGIWQDPAAMAPWEFRKITAAKSSAETQPVTSEVRKPATNVSTSVVKAQVSSTRPPVQPSTQVGAQKWPLFSPASNLFSIHVPSGGREFSTEIDLQKGSKANINIYTVSHLKIGYMILWGSGPRQDDTISTLFDKTVESLNDAFVAHGFPCDFIPEKTSSMKGYTGKVYQIQGCYFKGAIRSYFKIEGQTMKVFFVAVVSEDQNNPEIKEFLDSFIIN